MSADPKAPLHADAVLYSAPTHHRRTAVFLVLIGLAIRLVIAATTLGTNDVATWQRFGREVSQDGFVASYVADHELNHPPIPTAWAACSYAIADGDFLRFALLIRLPAILFDVLTCALLWRIGLRVGDRALALKLVAAAALNPALILIGAYHGNTDNAYAALALLAFMLVERRPWLAGLALGAAMNVKIIPMLLLPALVACVRKPADAARVVVGFAMPLATFILPLVMTGGVFFRKVFLYGSNSENWGVVLLIRLATGTSAWPPNQSAAEQFYHGVGGKVFMLAALAATALWAHRRQASPLTAGALAACAFLVFAPGFGVQYLALPAVLLLAASLRFGVYFALAGGLFVGSCYYIFLNHGPVMQSVFKQELFAPASFVGLIAWGVMGAYGVWAMTQRTRIVRV